jgi:hypothetical protein
MTPPGRLAEYDVPGLRRVLRGARIGLALPADKAHRACERANGPGSDEQLTAKLAEIWAELDRRGGRRLMEQIMDDEMDDDHGPGPTDPPADSTNTGQAECAYPGCLLIGKGMDGMCVKHCIALGRGDPEAREAARQFHAVRDRQSEPPHDAHWRDYPTKRKSEAGRRPLGPGKPEPEKENTHGGAKPPPAQPTTETGETTRGPEKIQCQKCGRDFDPRGYAGHGPTCKGPDGGKTGPRCPDCGKRCKNEMGLLHHYARTGHGGKARARASGQLTRDNDKRDRRAEAAALPPGAELPGAIRCWTCGHPFKDRKSVV